MSTESATASTRNVVVPSRSRLIAAILSVAALIVAVVVLWQPWGERDGLAYADLAPHRDGAWLGSLADGLAFAAAGVALGLAVCLLAPVRGRVLATVGAVGTALGGALFSAGMVGFGALAWYATNPAALSPEAGTALLAQVKDNPGHLLVVQMAGFLLFTLGALVLSGALWRARSVPRWLPVAYLVLTIATFATDGVVLNVVEAVQALAWMVVAFFAVRR
jgi:hypothetical protein